MTQRRSQGSLSRYVIIKRDPGFGWLRATHNLGVNKNLPQGKAAKCKIVAFVRKSEWHGQAFVLIYTYFDLQADNVVIDSAITLMASTLKTLVSS